MSATGHYDTRAVAYLRARVGSELDEAPVAELVYRAAPASPDARALAALTEEMT